MMKFGVICLLLLALDFTAPSNGQKAHLLVSKTILNHYIVENKPLTVTYEVYNIGDGLATNVELREENFDAAEYFSFISGAPITRWSQLAAGANLTHAIVLMPLSSGLFNFTSAKISYRAKVDASDVTFGRSSSPGEKTVFPLKEFNRRHSSHMMDWLNTILISAPSLVIPFFLWYMSHRKYTNISASGKKSK